MSSRRISVVLSGRDLESLLEGLEREDATLRALQGACVRGVVASRCLSRRAELLRLQSRLIEAFASAAVVEGEEAGVRPRPPMQAAGVVGQTSEGGSSEASDAVSPVREISAVEVGVPRGVWDSLCVRLVEAERHFRAVLGGRRADLGWVHGWLCEVEGLRRWWVM